MGGLCFVPVFHYFTDLPPFVGILLVLGILWTITEIFYRSLHRSKGDSEDFSKRVSNLLSRIDMSTILFFLGILMAVACLEEVGVLHELGGGLNSFFQGNHYAVTGVIGVLSSIVDNVPLVAGSMGMYPVQATGDMAVDGIFLAAIGLLCWSRWFHPYHWFCSRCCRNGIGEDYLWLVHEEDVVDSFLRLSLRYSLLLGYPYVYL